MKHISGGKATKSHTTTIEMASEVYAFLDKDPEVKKIGLGIIKQSDSRSSQRIIKINYLGACYKVIVVQKRTVQWLFVYTKEASDTSAVCGSMLRLIEFAEKKNWQVRFNNSVSK